MTAADALLADLAAARAREQRLTDALERIAKISVLHAQDMRAIARAALADQPAADER